MEKGSFACNVMFEVTDDEKGRRFQIDCSGINEDDWQHVSLNGEEARLLLEWLKTNLKD